MEKEVKQPGAAKYGNFIDYYRFNPARKRISFLPRDLVTSRVWKKGCIGLDIGCNTGELTSALIAHLCHCYVELEQKVSVREQLSHLDHKNVVICSNSQSHIPCTDKDGKKCWTRNTNSCGDLQTSNNLQTKVSDSTQNFKGMDTSSETAQNRCHQCHKDKDTASECKISMLGVDIDPILIQRAIESNTLPDHITYKTLDIMSEQVHHLDLYLARHEKKKFDFIFCFSVTMWIHLNHGDEGLRQFLRHVCANTRYLVVEPQPWKCYKSAMRRLRKLKCPEFDTFLSLKWRESVSDEMVSYLEAECGMALVEELGVTDWDRRLLLFESV